MSVDSEKKTSIMLSELNVSRTAAENDVLSGKPLLKEQSVVVKGWPTTSKPIKKGLITLLLDGLLDIVVLTLSLLFLAFALAVIHFDQQPTAEHHQTRWLLEQASRKGPSIFPLLFACAVGRATHAILLWRLEKGERIGILDLLAGSTSLTNTVTSQIGLRMFNICGLLLLAVWILSPIGGQASINQLSFGNGTSESNETFDYMIPNSRITGGKVSTPGITGEDEISDRSYTYTLEPLTIPLFLSSIMASADAKSSTLDVWGNVKIPVLESYENAATAADSDGWLKANDHQAPFVSLVGIPVMANPRQAAEDITFTIDTSYLHISCSTFNSSDYKEPRNIFEGNGAAMFVNDEDDCSINTSSSGSGFGLSSDEFYLKQMACNRPDDGNHEKARSFTYVDHGLFDNDNNPGASTCDVTTTYIEAEIVCKSTSPCTTNRLRRSELPNSPPERTTLDEQGFLDAGSNATNWGVFAALFVGSGPAQGGDSYPTIVQGYLFDPDMPSNIDYASVDYMPPNVTLPTKEDYEIRLGQLINAFWACLTNPQVLLDPTMMTQTISRESSGGPEGTVVNEYRAANSSTTTATRTTHFEIFVCHRVWSIILIIASVILILACLTRPIIACAFIHTPDLMLNVSSLATRDNPYIQVPEGGTSLEASDRARLLQKLRIRFGDVEPGDATGYLALTSVTSVGNKGAIKVRKGRPYR